MGLVPSREALHRVATAPDKPLPYISRPAESYVYKTNRTERTLGSGVPGVVAGITPLPAALLNTTMAVLHGAPSLELSQKIANELPDAVFIDDPAEASAAVAAAVAASRPPRRGGGGNGTGGQKAKGQGQAFGNSVVKESAAAQALRCGKAPFVYYYEHRVLPLTSEFFPSPDCILFRQLWHARQQQNPRYHFQLDQTWSPGALMDPTAHYESFTQLAASSLTDVQAACLTAAGAVPTKGSVLQAQADLEAAKAELNVAEGGSQQVKRSASGRAAPSPVPFATREEFYNLVVRTTEESMLFETDDALRNAVQSAGEGNEDAQCRRLRPVPCAIVLVRQCMAAQEYRYTYYLASHERHHRTSDNAATSTAAPAADQTSGVGQKGGPGRRRVPENQRRGAQATAVTGSAVRTAVKEAQKALLARPDGRVADKSDSDDESLMVPWLQVSAPQAPLDLAEVRVVGMYGCWTMEEILRHSLFLPAGAGNVSMGGRGEAAAVGSLQGKAQEAESRARIDAILRRACPHGVPSSTLLNIVLFEKQVGDKEQCHTYFSLCRLFAHGMRECILRDVMREASVSVLETTLGADDTGDGPIDAELKRERMEAELRELKRQQEHPTWQKFLRLVASQDTASGSNNSSKGCDKPSAFADLANCFLIRFSYVPQLQLCRQLRLLLTGMASMYPEPISLEAFQAAQRQRNMTAMAKKHQNHPTSSDTDGGGVAAADGSAQGGPAPPSRHPTSTAEAAFAPLSDPASRSSSSPTVNTAGSAGETSKADSERIKTGARRQQHPPQHPARLTLDPEVIDERSQEHTSELQKLQRDGFCCYASDGLVVFRISRDCVARALNQLGFALMRESIEALCVTLTATAPPPLTYRGELRPPVAVGSAGGQAWTMPISTAGSMNDDGDTMSCDVEDACDDDGHTAVNPAASAAASAHRDGATSLDLTMAAVKDLYCNAIRYSSDPASSFAAHRLFCSTHSSSDAARETPMLPKVAPLEQTPSDLIGVLPRNPIEQRRGRLLPLRGLLQEARVDHLHTAATAVDAGARTGAAAQANTSLLSSQQQQLFKMSEQHLFDVYTVSEALDGMPFRRLVELTHQVEHQRHMLIGNAEEEWPQMFIEAVDAQGNTEAGSVLSWSPMTAFAGRERRAEPRKHVGTTGVSEAATAAVNDEAGKGDESTASANLSQTLNSAGSLLSPLGGKQANPVPVSIRVHDPERILHTGDRIRFAACQGSTFPSPTALAAAQGLRPCLGDATSPSSASAEYLSVYSTPAHTPSRRSRKVSSTATVTHYGYWYVDDSLTTEDMVLSWMRRISGRARETHGNDTKWVRYPSAILSIVLQFVRVCRQKPSGSWLNTGHPLRLLHPMDDELVEWDMLQNFPDIVRTRRFRQWRFSHDGYVYFHGVTVRMPGSPPSLLAAPQPPSKSHAAAAQQDVSEPASVNNSRLMPYDGQTRVRHVDATSSDAVSSSTEKSSSPAMQHQQQNVFAGVPRPPPVMQCSVYGNSNSYASNNYPGSASPQMAYPISSFHPNGQLGQQQRRQQQQSHQEQQRYQHVQLQHIPPPQTYYYASPMNVHGGVPMQPPQLPQPSQPPQQPMNMTMYVPMTCNAEPYYAQQPARIVSIPQPPTNTGAMPPSSDSSNNNASGSNTALYFNEVDVANAQARSATNGDNGGRSPRGGSQHMQFSLHHMDSGNSLHSYDRAASNAMLEPTHVTSSFYGELYGQSPQQPPPPTLQPQQQQLTSCASASAHHTADHRSEVWLGSGPHASEEMEILDGVALTSTSKTQEVPMYPPTANTDARSNTSNAQAFGPLPAQGGTLFSGPHQPQQPLSPQSDSVGRASGMPSSNAGRRSTADYPPRRMGGTFLAGGSNSGGGRGTGSTMVMHPTVQRTVSQPIQTSHVDPTKREAVAIAGESGAALRLPIPKSRTTQNQGGSSVQAPTASIWQQQQVQQQQQQQQGPVLTPSLLSSSAGSFREGAAAATTADVIKTDGITVHVMQRKSSISVRRAVTSVSVLSPASSQCTPHHSSFGGGAQAPQANGNGSSIPNASPTDTAAAANYGAMGVSPTGGVDATTTIASTIVTSPEDGRGALAQLTYEMPVVMTPTNNSRENSFLAGANSGFGSCSTAQLSGGPTAGGTTSPQRRRSLRVSHNPYAARDVNMVHGGTPSTTPILAHTSFHSHVGGAAPNSIPVSGGAQEMRRGQSGPDAFQAALDAQYSGENDFGAAGPVFASAFAQQNSSMAHGSLYGQGDTSSTTVTQVKHSSFYAVPEDGDPQQSYSSHEMYRDKIADGTTQGFYYSMDGPNDSDGNAAQQLYGRGEGVGYQSGHQHEGLFSCSGSTPYSNIPAPPALHRSRRGSC